MRTPVYKIEVLVIDFENNGPDDAIALIEQCKHLSAKCIKVESRDAGEWHDRHPLNLLTTDKSAYFDSLPELSSK